MMMTAASPSLRTSSALLIVLLQMLLLVLLIVPACSQVQRHFPNLFRGGRSEQTQTDTAPVIPVSVQTKSKNVSSSSSAFETPRNLFQEGFIQLSNDVWTQEEIEIQLFDDKVGESSRLRFRQSPANRPIPHFFYGTSTTKDMNNGDDDDDNDDLDAVADKISLVQTTVTTSQIPVVTGSIHVAGKLYQIRQLPGGDLVVDQRGRDEDFDDEMEIEDEDLEEWMPDAATVASTSLEGPLEVDFELDPHRFLLSEELSRNFSDLPEYEQRQVEDAYRRRRMRDDDDGSFLDIMIVYTRNAMCAAAKHIDNRCKATAQNKATIEGIIELAVKETNEAFASSGISTKLRLVKVHYEDKYDDSKDWPKVFSHFTGSNDGFMDYIHAMRDQYGADFVSFIVNSRGYCGSAHRPKKPSPDRAFSMVRWDCATGHYTFTHELAHTLGCRHDLKSTKSTVESGDFNFGFQYSPPSDHGRSFRTLMAYNCPNGGCQRILRFSNPTRSRRGIPFGSTKADNARFISERLPLYASFRPSVVLSIPRKPQQQLPKAIPVQSAGNSYARGTRKLATVPYPGSLIGAAGNMFEVVAKRAIKITGFSVMTYAATTVEVEVFMLNEVGSFIGNERNPHAWTRIGGATLESLENEATALPNGSTLPVFVASGTTQAFYVTFTESSNYNRYSRASNFGEVFAQNDDLQFKVGYTVSYPFAYHPRAPRVFNGEIFYEVVAQGDPTPLLVPSSPGGIVHPDRRTFRTTFASNNGYSGNMFTIHAKTDLVIDTFDLNAGSTSDGLVLKIYTKSGSFGRSDFNPSLTWFELCNTAIKGLGESKPTHVPSEAVRSVAVKANSKQSFFITFTGPHMRYTSALLDPNYLENDDLSLVSSAGTQWPFKRYFPNRIWNGVIHYVRGTEGASIQGDDTVVFTVRNSGAATTIGGHGAVEQRSNNS